MRQGNNRKFRLHLILLFLIFASHSAGQIVFYSLPARENLPHGNIFSSTRTVVSLNGTYQVAEEKNGQSLGEVHIPGVFQSGRTLLFQRTFPRVEKRYGGAILHFLKLVGEVQISLNGTELYRGADNYLPLHLPISLDLLDDSTNVLAVRLQPWTDHRGNFPRWIPVNLPRIESGLAGAVFLELLPPVFLTEVTPQLTFREDSVRIAARVLVKAAHPLQGNLRLVLRISEKGKVLYRSQPLPADSLGEGRWQNEFLLPTLRLPRWSPRQPRNYRLEVQLFQEGQLVDQLSQPLPLRKIAYQKKKLILNDQPLFIEGINYLFQNRQGVDLPTGRILRHDLEKIRADGFNALRIGFHPLPDFFYHLTDSLGLLVFQDLPVLLLNRNTLSARSSRQAIERYVENFLLAVQKHPSVVGVGLASWFDPDPMVLRFLDSLKTAFQPANGPLLYFSTPLANFASWQLNMPIMLEILERNHQAETLSHLENRLPTNQPVFFSGLSKAISYRVDSTNITHDLEQIKELFLRVSRKHWRQRLAGNFIPLYSDYYLQTPSLQAGPQNQFILNQMGLYTLDRQLKPLSRTILKRPRKFLLNQQAETERKKLGTFVFVFLGLINFLVFLLFYRTLADFRKNLHRAIRRPHGFFTDMLERRIIPHGQNFFLLLVVAINGAIILEGVFYFFRNNLLMDYLLSLVFTNSALKLQISRLIWNPLLAIPLLTFLLGLTILLLAVPIRFFSIFREQRIHTRQAVAVSTWAAAPFLLLLPIGMFFYNLMIVLNSYWILLFVLVYFHVWFYFRWINGTRVMLALSYTRVFLFTVLVMVVVAGALFFYWEKQFQLTTHVEFLYRLFKSMAG